MRASAWIGAVLLVGCGGGEPTATTSTAETTGGGDEAATVDTPPDEAPDETPDTAPAAGPAHVRIVVRVDGQEAAAEVKLLDAQGQVAGQGAAGTSFDVTSGTFTAEAHIADAAVIVNRPTQQVGPFEVAPGADHVQEITFERARVRLQVNQRGRPVRRARVTLRRQGANEDPIELTTDDREIPFLPGRYDANVRFGAQSIDVTGLMFMGGAQQNVPINVN